MPEFPITERSRIRRVPKRGQYDRDTIYRILDEGLLCHVGLVEDHQPVVIPMNYARHDDALTLHGATSSRLLKYVQAGHPVCVTVTLLDGLVLARSVYHHSMNYRSVVVFGRGRLIEAEKEKLAALEVLTDHILRGRWQDAREPNRQELDATRSSPSPSRAPRPRCAPVRQRTTKTIINCNWWWAGVLRSSNRP